MDNDDIAYSTKIALLKFVERVVEGTSSSEEIEILPQIASILFESMWYVN